MHSPPRTTLDLAQHRTTQDNCSRDDPCQPIRCSSHRSTSPHHYTERAHSLFTATVWKDCSRSLLLNGALSAPCTSLRCPAGEWRGLEVAIKTVLFQSGDGDNQTALVASEAAIASNLVHHNIVSTYSHEICNVLASTGMELPVFKFYLIQVCFSDATFLLLLAILHDQLQARSSCQACCSQSTTGNRADGMMSVTVAPLVPT